MSLNRAVGIFALAIGLLLALASGAHAASLQPVGSGFDEPIFLTSAPDNPDRLFVVERKGRIVELSADGSRSVFADLRTAVGCEEDCAGERGLLSIALSPDFAASGRFFVFYGKDQGEGDIHVAEMTASATFAPLSTLRNVLTIPHPTRINHYGGQLQFGPEGNLFISTGDGGGSNDPDHNAQDFGSLLGKILRIDPDPSGPFDYTVPVGNPFGDEIWALGLRNPFRFSFDRGGSGLWIGDVGQGAREEVDHGPAPGLGGSFNYGWSCFEGTALGNGDDEACDGKTAGDFVDPVFDYEHIAPEGGCPNGFAIIGGYVSRDPGVGELSGRYVYGDLCGGGIRSFAIGPGQPYATDRSEGIDVFGLNSFGEDSCGRLYAISGAGSVYRIAGASPTNCAAVAPGPVAVLSPSFVGIKPLRRRVVRNRRALITAWVSPCQGRQGDPVTLWRGNRRIGTRHFDKVCTARFRPRISRRSGFRATVKATGTHAAAISRKVTIKPKRKPRRRHR
jgi:Glucose / Sorbosone dehydrogenase